MARLRAEKIWGWRIDLKFVLLYANLSGNINLLAFSRSLLCRYSALWMQQRFFAFSFVRIFASLISAKFYTFSFVRMFVTQKISTILFCVDILQAFWSFQRLIVTPNRIPRTFDVIDSRVERSRIESRKKIKRRAPKRTLLRIPSSQNKSTPTTAGLDFIVTGTFSSKVIIDSFTLPKIGESIVDGGTRNWFRWVFADNNFSWLWKAVWPDLWPDEVRGEFDERLPGVFPRGMNGNWMTPRPSMMETNNRRPTLDRILRMLWK